MVLTLIFVRPEGVVCLASCVSTHRVVVLGSCAQGSVTPLPRYKPSPPPPSDLAPPLHADLTSN